MTLIAGFVCRGVGGGVVIAADMEETSGYTGKRPVNKLQPISFFGEWGAIIAGAGDSAIIENAARRLRNEFAKIRPFDEDEVYGAIDRVLAEVHSKYIDPVPDCEGIELLIGVRCNSNVILISTSKRTPKPENDFACIGFGRDLATYFADKLYDPWALTIEHVANLATFILREAKKSSRSVGLGSQISILQEGGQIPIYYGADTVESAEEEIPSFDVALNEFKRKLDAARPRAFRGLSSTSQKLEPEQ